MGAVRCREVEEGHMRGGPNGFFSSVRRCLLGSPGHQTLQSLVWPWPLEQKVTYCWRPGRPLDCLVSSCTVSSPCGASLRL